MRENRKKKDDFSSHVPEIEKKIGYTFKDKSLLMQAFTRTSFCNENRGAGNIPYQSNEVLEFFGDSVLGAAIISIFMKDLSSRYEYGIKTDLGEGDFSNIKSKLSDKKNLSDRILELGLYEYFRMGEGDRKLNIEKEPSVMEDLFESIIGAVYIDCGMDIRQVITTVSRMLDVKKYVGGATRDKNAPIQSYKNALQEWCADKKHRLPPPEYKTVGESGPDHKKIYERAVYIGGRKYAVGKGKNQKLADADAAERALEILKAEAEPKPKAPDKESVAKLKEHSRASHLPPPTFRDLGETDRSTSARREYAVMCKFAGVEVSATAPDKATARCAAAEMALAAARGESRKEKRSERSSQDKKKPPRVTKSLRRGKPEGLRKGSGKK